MDRSRKFTGRPEGLRGKDIGLYYRDISRAKNAQEAAKVAEIYDKKSKEITGRPNRQHRASRKAEKQRHKNLGPVSHKNIILIIFVYKNTFKR